MDRLPIHLCNEVVRELDFAAQCRFAREAGYDGLEVAPFTLAEDPTRIGRARIGELRAISEGEGAPVAGLHWLLAAPEGLSITAEDPATVRRTLEAGRRLVGLCAELGGSYLVHGSPRQRELVPGREAEGRARGLAWFAAMAASAEAAGVTYVVEPLSRHDTAFVTDVGEALAIIGEIGSPALKTMIDCYATAANGENVPAVLERHVREGRVFHVHLNDANKGAPGDATIDFSAVLAALRRHRYGGAAAVEPFVHEPDGPACAARAIRHLRDLERAALGAESTGKLTGRAET